ncbi:unnamed protein product [Heterobilharzia americana]|nr:unnamed protein product [Heterobilharzia americana]
MYRCELCGCSFESDKESYEHDISEKHHRKFEESEARYGRQASHFCAICYCKNIQGINSWLNHTRGSRHKSNLKSFYEYYATSDQTVSVLDPTQTDHNESQRSEKAEADTNGSNILSEKRPSPSKKPKTTRTSTALEGGMMLNILETIHKESVNILKNGKLVQKVNKNSKAKSSNTSKRSSEKLCRKNRSKYSTTTQCSSVVAKNMIETGIPAYSEVITHPLTPQRSSVTISASESTSKCAELQCMEKALIVSQELQSLKLKQNQLEEQLRNIESELNLVRTKRRELKQERSSLLRGINHSDSEAESHADSSRSELIDTRRNITLPAQRPNVKVVASIAPLDAPVDAQLFDQSAYLYNPKTENKQQIDASSYAISSKQSDFQQSRNVFTSSPLASETSLTPAASSISHIDASVQPHQTISGLLNSVPVSSSSNPVDLGRLALIRQALQSPDSWQFTFDEVDQMLKQAAAKTSTNAFNPNAVTLGQSSQIRPTEGPTVPAEDKTPSIPMKGEPDIYVTSTMKEPSPHVPENHTVSIKSSVSGVSSVSCLPQISSVRSLRSASQTIKTRNSSSSSSFTSSDDENCDQQRKSDGKNSYPVKAKLESDKDYSAIQAESTSSSVLNMLSSSKGNIKIGEFHAFGGRTSAVIDMAVNPATLVAFIGGQNGTIVECDLKTHQCTSNLPPRDASITRLCLNVKGESIYVGYYDQYFAEYCVKTGLLVHKNIFSSRIEALAAAPSPDVPFIFMGLFGGEILRYNVETHAIGFLCRHTSGHSQSESVGGKTKDSQQVTHASQSNESAGVTSLCLVQSGTSLLLIVGGLDRSISIRSASDGELVCYIQNNLQKGPPQGIASLPSGSLFTSYSDRSIRIYNWKTGVAELTFHVHKIASSCVMRRYIAVGDSEGTVRVYKFQPNGLPFTRPIKVYFISARGAVTSLTSSGDTLIAGSLDGSVTVILVNEPASDYTCLYGKKCGENCGIGFMDRRDLLHHVLNEHLRFGSKKTIMCGWGAGRCRVRFTETQTIRSISDHLLTHIPD